jgi:hypothetical protein
MTLPALQNETLGDVWEDATNATVVLDVWRYVVENGQQTGYIRRSHGRPVGEIVADLTKRISRLVDEYATLGGDFKYARGVENVYETECPEAQRIAVYAVTGGSEGHYVHVALHVRDVQGEYGNARLVVKNLMLVKTFKGMKHARKIANRLADALGV